MNSSEPKGYVVAKLREALAKDSRVNDLNIEVNVTGAKVFLTGKVASSERRDSITEVVNELLPDLEVCNETEVLETPEPGGSERLP